MSGKGHLLFIDRISLQEQKEDKIVRDNGMTVV